MGIGKFSYRLITFFSFTLQHLAPDNIKAGAAAPAINFVRSDFVKVRLIRKSDIPLKG
jgi:hypothetical protein